MEKLSVPLAAVVPSEANPRRDFGDIKALAAAIEATGGQCVNPPVVVKDGNAWRVVDGERRLRALRLVWGEAEGAEVDVLACEDYDAADEAVAMLATDDKKQLTEEEKAAGAQRMLLLGVDDVRVAGAAGVDVTTVRRARRVVSPDLHRQASLEQLAAAAELGEGEDAEAVLSAPVGEWRAELVGIQRARKNRERYAALVAAFEGMGGRVLGEGEDVPDEGFHFVRYAYDADGLPADATGWLGAAWAGGSGLRLYEPGAEPVDAEKEALELRRAAHREDVAELKDEMLRFAYEGGGATMADDPEWRIVHTRLAAAVAADRRDLDERFMWEWEYVYDARAEVQACPPSMYEVATWLAYHTPASSLLNYNGEPSTWEAERLAPAYDALVADGWEPTEACRRVRGLAAQALDGADE